MKEEKQKHFYTWILIGASALVAALGVLVKMVAERFLNSRNSKPE